MSCINRSCHVLRREKSLAIPRNVIFFDTETTQRELPDGNIEHVLDMGWACYYRCGDSTRREKIEWLFFTEPEPFWLFVLSHCPTKNKTWVIAHNIGFDFTVVEGFRFLTDAGFRVKFFHSKGLTTVIKVTTKGKSIAFVDSCNWFDMSLKELGDLIGVPKLTIDFDTADFTYRKTYCKRDVEILIAAFKSLVKFLQSNRISRLCYTRASTAMAAYLLKHLDFPIWIHNNAEAIELERECYLGGRTECFFIGELTDGPYYILDVNSLYPFVMYTGLYPVKYVKIVHDISLDSLRGYLETFACCAKVLLKTPEPVYGLRWDRTVFPVGEFWAFLTTPELDHAILNDRVRDVADVVLYDKAAIFRSFVDRFYRLRRDFASAGVSMYERYTKIFLNSLYGKFGQKGEVWKKIAVTSGEPDRIEECIDAETGRRSRLRYLLGELWQLKGYEETRHSFPAIAGHVTSYARMYLWHLMNRCGRGNYFYCDTDSLFVNQQGYDNLVDLIDDDLIGGLKVERKVDNLHIYGLKDYIADDKTVLKGIKKTAVKVSDTEYRQEQWPTLQGLLCSNRTGKYVTVNQTKNLYRTYHKGNVTKAGWTIPFSFDAQFQHGSPIPELPF